MCNHKCMIPNATKTKTLVVGRSRSCLGFPFGLVPTLTFLALSLTASDSKLTSEDHVCGNVFRISQRIGMLLYQGVQFSILQGVSCQSRFVCGMHLHILCLALEYWMV